MAGRLGAHADCPVRGPSEGVGGNENKVVIVYFLGSHIAEKQCSSLSSIY